MNTTRSVYWFTLGMIASSLFCLCQADSNVPAAVTKPFTHVVSWGPWNGHYGNEAPPVFLDGKFIGSIEKAYPYLTSFNVGSQDRIKIEIPLVTKLHATPHDSIYSFAKFLGTWLNKGVHLVFFQGDQEYKLHTLTWSQYKTDAGRWKPDLTSAHLVLDGEDIGQIDVGLTKLGAMAWDKNTILQVYIPYNDAPYPLLDIPNGLLDTAKQLGNKYGYVVEDISPGE